MRKPVTLTTFGRSNILNYNLNDDRYLQTDRDGKLTPAERGEGMAPPI